MSQRCHTVRIARMNNREHCALTTHSTFGVLNCVTLPHTFDAFIAFWLKTATSHVREVHETE